MNKDSRMRSLYLSGEWVRICGWFKSTGKDLQVQLGYAYILS